MGARNTRDEPGIWISLAAFIVLSALFAVAFIEVLSRFWQRATSGDTEYTVTVTGVDGLNPALDLRSDRPTLNPVLGLTVHIDNSRYKLREECVHLLSSVVVSYGDALLGTGTVPAFCAERLEVREAAATAWGMDVQVPRFLRNRLADELERGEAVVDVAVRTPPRFDRGGEQVLVCKAKIEGGVPSPCLRTEVYRYQGSTAAVDH